MRYAYLFALLVLLTPIGASAVTDRLYQAEVEVLDQSAQARADGMAEAMGRVLVKVSGAGRILEDRNMHASLQGASRYVQRFQYRTDPIPLEQQQPNLEGRLQTSRLMLDVSFEPRGIDQLLRQHGYAVWGQVRPEVLVWMGVEQEGSRLLVGADDAGLVRQVLERSARQRALPIRLPLLDLEDRRQVQLADLWGGFYDEIQQASQRYQTQATLIGRLQPLSARQWEVQWTLLQGGESRRWQMSSEDVSALIAYGVEESADWLANRFAKFAQDSEGELGLLVEGVADLLAYRRLLDHLSGISGVQAVRVETLDGDSVRLRLRVDGGRDALMRTIALGQRLERIEQLDPNYLYYRLRP